MQGLRSLTGHQANRFQRQTDELPAKSDETELASATSQPSKPPPQRPGVLRSKPPAKAAPLPGLLDRWRSTLLTIGLVILVGATLARPALTNGGRAPPSSARPAPPKMPRPSLPPPQLPSCPPPSQPLGSLPPILPPILPPSTPPSPPRVPAPRPPPAPAPPGHPALGHAALVARLNSQFLNGHPSNDLASTGVLIRQFDSLSDIDHHRSWQPCPMHRHLWCGKFHAQWPASVVNTQMRHTYYVDRSGFVLDASRVAIFCAYGSDGNSMAHTCGGGYGDGETCIPGCYPTNRQCARMHRDWTCSWPPSMLREALEVCVQPARLPALPSPSPSISASPSPSRSQAQLRRANPSNTWNEIVIDTRSIEADTVGAISAFFFLKGTRGMWAAAKVCPELCVLVLTEYGFYTCRITKRSLGLTASLSPGLPDPGAQRASGIHQGVQFITRRGTSAREPRLACVGHGAASGFCARYLTLGPVESAVTAVHDSCSLYHHHQYVSRVLAVHT